MGPMQNFAYSFDVRDARHGPLSGKVTDGFGEGLLGSAPELSWEEYTPAPWKLYARVTLRASHGKSTEAAGISFVIDRGMLTLLRTGDVIHVAALPSLGVSVLRDDFLIAAAGAAATLSRMPLGSQIAIRFPEPTDVPVEIQPGAYYRPEDYPARPVEVSVGRERWAMWQGRPTMGLYDVFVVRSVHDGEPRLSMERSGSCPQTSAHTSAQLMERDGYLIVEQ